VRLSSSVKERIIVRAVENKIALYSPHTALDCVAGGINDWLADGLGERSDLEILEPHSEKDAQQAFKVSVFAPSSLAAALRTALTLAGCGNIGKFKKCSFNTDGYGTFLSEDEKNKHAEGESVDETKIEMVRVLQCLFLHPAASQLHCGCVAPAGVLGQGVGEGRRSDPDHAAE
jgi:putative NIF3 family GTP cyclohydrolase 1 type 2